MTSLLELKTTCRHVLELELEKRYGGYRGTRTVNCIRESGLTIIELELELELGPVKEL